MLWNPDKVRDPEYSGHHISALSLHEVALFVADHQLVCFFFQGDTPRRTATGHCSQVTSDQQPWNYV